MNTFGKRCLGVFVTAIGLGFWAYRLPAEEPTDSDPPRHPWEGGFSIGDPPELQFSCAVLGNSSEDAFAEQIVNGDPVEQLKAAQALWYGRSRRHASDVLKYLAGPPPGGDAYRAFQREVEKSLQPEAILRELKEGDYRWGTWLAFLRPAPELVPVLLAGLKEKPDLLAETMLALGNSGDVRAADPLFDLLAADEYKKAGDAARALGYLGGERVEAKLIESLSRDNIWLQVNAGGALARIGTLKAIPALKKVAEDDRYTGALNVQGMARHAMAMIVKRNGFDPSDVWPDLFPPVAPPEAMPRLID